MSRLQLKTRYGAGRVAHVTPETAGWSYVGFDLYRLKPGESVGAATGEREVCLVFVSGRGSVAAGGRDFGTLGARMSPFEGKPWSVYVPQSSRWQVTPETEVELAVCSAPGLGGGLPPRVIAPDGLGQEVRGKGTNTRYVTNILPEGGEPADSLLVVEVITPGGHTSSYPPHKHDQDNLPGNPISRKPTTTGSTRRRASPSSASTPTTARSTRPSPSRMATWCWSPGATIPAPPATATTSII